MTEKIRIRLDKNFYMQIEAVKPEDDSDDFWPVERVQELTPYGMLLAGIGSCTAMVVTTYAQNHGVGLHHTEITLEYEREFKQDCENCEGIDRYDERIYETIQFEGDLSDDIRGKLARIAHQCPIEKMIVHGVEIIHTNDG